MWSLYVGRPWGINIRDISISRPPKELDKTRNHLWKAYTDQSNTTTSGNQQKELYNPVEACADSNISLCAMMRRLSRTLLVIDCDESVRYQLINGVDMPAKVSLMIT